MRKSWKPSKSQAREFAEKMTNDAEFKAAYLAKKEKAADKRRANSKFDYQTAGGFYVPTEIQYKKAFELLQKNDNTVAVVDACRAVADGYICQERVGHDNIHIINEIIRSNKVTI